MSDELSANDLLLAEQFWDEIGTDGKSLPVSELASLAAARPVTADDIAYLRARYAFLDICNGDVAEIPPVHLPAKITTAQSGWKIHDRGDRIIAGPGRLRYGAYRLINEDDEEGGGGQGIIPIGTLIQQMFDTAHEVIALAAQKPWPVAEILGGDPTLIRAAWMASKKQDVSLNYSPTAADEQIFAAIKEHARTDSRSDKKRPKQRLF